MEIDKIAKEVLASNLSAETKLSVLECLFKEKEKGTIYNQPAYVPITYPSTGRAQPWYREITCSDNNLKYTDSNWIQQQWENTKADIDAVLNSKY